MSRREKRHQTAIEALTNAREIEAAAEARYNHGEGTVIETAQTRALTAQAQFSVVNTQGTEQQSYAALLCSNGGLATGNDPDCACDASFALEGRSGACRSDCE